jgi:non-specific protein-tyrosine kinase
MQETSRSELWRYLAIVRKWGWLIAAATILGGLAGFIGSKLQTPIYQASTTLLINEAPSTRSGVDYNSLLASERLARTYVQLMTERMVLEDVIPRLQNRTSVEWLKGNIAVSVVRDTQLMQVSVEHPNPVDAADIANTLAAVFAAKVKEMQATRYQDSKDNLAVQVAALDQQIQQTRAQLDGLAAEPAQVDSRSRLEAQLAQYQQSYATLLQTYEQIRFAEAQTSSNVTQVELAVPNPSPIRPRTSSNTLLAAVVGLLLALGAAFLIEMLDDTLKHTSQLAQAANLPVLGFIPFFETEGDGARSLIVATQPRSPIAERFRSLRTSIQFASVDKPLRTLLVTSPAPGDGKTTVAANLAVAVAQGSHRVALVDADLRRPSLHKAVSVPNTGGMSDLFVQPKVFLNGSMQATLTDGLQVLTGGQRPPNPAELMGSDRMLDILGAVAQEADLVIIDSPPVTSVTDAVVLAPRVDGVVLVVRPGMTKLAAAREAILDLRRAGANVLGLVVNGVKAEDAQYYYSSYYHYYYYHYYDEERQLTGWPKLRRDLDQWLAGATGGRLGQRRKSRSKAGATSGAPQPSAAPPPAPANGHARGAGRKPAGRTATAGKRDDEIAALTGGALPPDDQA